jgi:hypothetical protein
MLLLANKPFKNTAALKYMGITYQDRACSMHGKIRNSYKILVVKFEGKRPRHKCEDNIKMYLKEVGYESVEWIQLTQGRV